MNAWRGEWDVVITLQTRSSSNVELNEGKGHRVKGILKVIFRIAYSTVLKEHNGTVVAKSERSVLERRLTIQHFHLINNWANLNFISPQNV